MVNSKDKEILKKLQEDSRQSFAEVGRAVGLSPSATRERIIKMEDSGLIEKYSIKLNQKLLGNDLEVIILVKLFHGKLRTFLKLIPDMSEVQSAYRITGNDNIHLQLALTNQAHLQNVIDQLMPYGDTQTMLILSDVFQQKY